MDSNWFRAQSSQMVEYIASYMEGVEERPPLHNVTPGYLRPLIPEEAPETPDSWDDVMKDIDRVIMPGMTHWQSPHFHAYYPAGTSYPSILGDMLTNAFGCIAMSWMTCPAATELELSMMDWLAKMLQLPKHFLFSEKGRGGGTLMTSASESVLIAILSAREAMADKLRAENPDITSGQIIDKLVAYTSELANISVEKAGLMAFVRLRKLPVDSNGSLRGPILEEAIKEDQAKGLVPFFSYRRLDSIDEFDAMQSYLQQETTLRSQKCCATVGTTSVCSFDDLQEVGPICNAHDIWLHIDAAYAGNACICPEFRYLLQGVEHCTTLCINPHKWMHTNVECSALWVKNRYLLTEAFNADAVYVRRNGNKINFCDWQIHLGRRFRSLKLWFVIRGFGVEALRDNIRKDVKLAKEFEALVKTDKRYEVVGQVVLGIVCFRLKGSNSTNENLLDLINSDKRLHMVPGMVRGEYVLRFVVVSRKTKFSDVRYAWNVILELSKKATSLKRKIESNGCQ